MGTLSKVSHSQSTPLLNPTQPLHFLRAISSVTLLQLLQIYSHSLSVSTLTLKFGSEFVIAPIELPFHSYQSWPALTRALSPYFLTINLKFINPLVRPLIHGPQSIHLLCPELWSSLNRALLSKSSELCNSLFESHLLKFAFNI